MKQECQMELRMRRRTKKKRRKGEGGRGERESRETAGSRAHVNAWGAPGRAWDPAVKK